jgi:hypothetical protein
MKNILKVSIFAAALHLMTPSCSYLDIVPDGIPDIEQHAFAMRSQAEKFLFTCYSYIPVTGSIVVNPALLAGHEIVITPTSRSYNGTTAYYIQQGGQRSSSPYLCFWNGSSGGKNLWRGISDCNIFLEHINDVPDMTGEEKSQWEAEVEFLKVYYHYYLVRMYGPVPIRDKNIPVSASEEEVKVFRNTLDECFDYMLGKLNEVITKSGEGLGLPDKTTVNKDAGRVTKGIAIMLRAQVAVTAASPLFNGSSKYKGITDSRGVEIFNPNKTAAEKQKRWEDAAKYCEEAYSFLKAQGRGLYRFRPIDAEEEKLSQNTKDKLTIRMALTNPTNNPEVVWANSNNWVGESAITRGYGDLQSQSHPRDLNSARKNSNSYHRGNFAVPLKVARQFFTKNGLPIELDKEWLNIEPLKIFKVTKGRDTIQYLKDGQETALLNRDRELRYYASLGFDRGVWYGQGDETDDGQFLQARQGEIGANSIDNSWNLTGIFTKKLLHYRTSFGGKDSPNTTTTCTPVQYPWPLMKMNDLILLYAEAVNETGDYARAKTILNEVRERAKLPTVDDAYNNYSTKVNRAANQVGVRQIIREERMSELALEGYRYWDLLRWEEAENELSKPITGWTLSGNDPESYYIEAPVYPAITFSNPRDYFSPIPTEEILRNRNILQNPGW